MTPPSPAAFDEALASFRAGDLASARTIIDAALARDARDARALHLSGEIASRAGDLARAGDDLHKALAITPASEIRASLARVQWRRGAIPEAAASAQAVLAARPGFAPAVLVAAFCQQVSGDLAGCRQTLASLDLAGADASIVNFALHALAEIVTDDRRVFASLAPAPAAAPALSFTVVVCSIDDAKLARCRARLEAALAPGFEFLVIRDARSLTEAYNRALALAHGEAIVFMHDDVEILSPGLDSHLSSALARADVVGVAGTRLLAGPTLGWGGQSPLAGWLVHGGSAAGAWTFSVLALKGGTLGGMQGLDGCFIAARTAAARRIGFDATTFDAFHLYDLDFCLRAHREGLRVAVDTDILLAHASRGDVAGPSWEAQARRFAAKFAPLGSEAPKPNHFHAASLAGAGQALALHSELNGFCVALGSRED